jgi:hypothetical protein
MVFVLLSASLGLRIETARSGPNRTEAVLRALPPERFRPLQLVCFDLAIALAALSRQWASVIVGSILVHHNRRDPELPSAEAPVHAAAANDAETGPSADRPDTLAGLPLVEAQREVAANAERFSRYYEFALVLIADSVKAHDEPNVLGHCIRLALVLATETSVLPRVHSKFMQLLVSMVRARPSLVHARLLAEHETSEKTLMRRLLTEEPALLLSCDDSHAYCLEMLRLAPPAEASLCAMLDACAARIVRGDPEREELEGLQIAVRLLCDASAVVAARWREQHGSAADALKVSI